ncbi:MAG: glycosyltransferase family 4 protein [Bacteroidales bacterium]|nr:glycosyltransferase family 4 protein [Bacteroidales bacterium]
MTKIAVIGTRGFPGIQGGVEMHCENIYPRMNHVGVTLYRRKPYLTEASAHTFPGISYVDLPSTRVKGFEAVLHSFLSVCHCIVHRPQVVHIHNIGPAMFAPLLRLFGLKVVLTYHSPNYEHKKWGMVARTLLKMSESLALRFSNHIIFVNKFQREKFAENILAKSTYIPNGIPAVERSEATDFLRRHGIHLGKYILSVGRLTPEKGFEYLIEAVQHMPDVEQLVIAGGSDHDTSYFEKLKQLDVNGKVVFTGFTSGEDLRQLYSHAQLYVLSSVNEGFPLVLLEAMAYGLPLAVSDIPATHLVDLPASTYFAKADAESMRRCISAQLAASAGTPVAYNLTEFNWPSIAQRTQEILAAVR